MADDDTVKLSDNVSFEIGTARGDTNAEVSLKA